MSWRPIEFSHMTIAMCSLIVCFVSTSAFAQVVKIENASVHTIVGGVIEDGDILIRDGTIVAVGTDLDAPEGARIVNGKGLVATPGIVAPYSAIGLTEINLDAEANDSEARGDGFELSASLNAADALNPDSTLIPVNRAGGVTLAMSAPDSGAKLFGGKAVVFQLSGQTDSIVKEYAGQVLAMGFNGAAREGGSRMGAWATLRDTLKEARAYAANPREYYRRSRDERFVFSDLEALGPVLTGDVPLFVHVNRASDIRILLALKREFDIGVVIVGGTEAWRVAPELAETQTPVIIDTYANLPARFESMGATLENAARLEAAGVEIAFYNPPGFGAHNLRALPQLAGNAVAHGMTYEGALQALTINPAKMLGVGDRYGSIEVGKAGDIVLWDGDPLELSTRPVAVYIAGGADFSGKSPDFIER